MSGGAFVTIKVGRSGAASAHVGYVTRERATEGKQERVWTRNVPEYADHPDHAERGMTYRERTADLREYARQLEEDELEKPHHRSRGEKRTHYRAIYSFDREVTDEKAREMVDAHLEENFPKARAIAAIHRDTDNAHVHVQIAARQIDDRKVHLNHRMHRRLDERWARIYGKEFGREIEKEHLAKKTQWREWMREAREARERGEEPPPRPKRVARERNQVKERRAMHAKQYGLHYADQAGIRDNQRRASSGERPATTRGERADRAARGTDRSLAERHGATRSVSQPSTAERDQQQSDRQQPRRVSRASRAVSNRNQSDDRARQVGLDRSEQTRADSPSVGRAQRADEQRISEQHRPDEAARGRGGAPRRAPEQIPQSLAGAAQNDHAQGDGRDVHEHDFSGAFDRVLSLMASATDADAARGRDEVARVHGGDAAGARPGNRAGDREQVVPPPAGGADRGADKRRERTPERARLDPDEFVPHPASQPAQPQITDAGREEIMQRIHAGRLRAQYLVDLVNIGLKERETGQSAEAERLQLRETARVMLKAEAAHERAYGGKPRVVLMPEERDYLTRHKDAPTEAQARDEIRRELAQALIIGEPRAGESFERTPERQPERQHERTLERDRGGFGFSR